MFPIRAWFAALLYPSSLPLNSDLVDTYGPANAGADTPSASRTTANAFISFFKETVISIHYIKFN
jgi:hypothetical protein